MPTHNTATAIRIPKTDGEGNDYISPKANLAGVKKWFNPSKTVVFVNGMINSPKDHADSALALSLLQMCKVHGIYNYSRIRENSSVLVKAVSVIEDLSQCLGDKVQWDSTGFDRDVVNINTWYQSNFGNPANSVKYVEQWLARNPPALSLFKYIRARPGQAITVFSHSQGNLITSNALTGMYLLDPSALKNITVNSYASPSVFWPKGFTHNRYAYTLDLVPLLAGVGNSLSFSTSTIGGLSGVASHGFENYRRDDPVFIVNQYRWGALRLTASMDEAGLANALVGMGINMPRIYNIFVRLDDVHNNDVDDVALLYIEKIKHRSNIMRALKKHTKLKALLIKSMAEGWTTNREKAAIKMLR